ncbi:alanine racemase, partial [Candidatus Uhrbacteria bacterium]|nr:alanine racemase [Candidatus Uhrbacteria bacterium]MBD3283840.1 alanine racemase [Candidatus Uhrbacteria bacterium]
MPQTPQKTWVEISKSALLHNAKSLKALVKPAQYMAVVKANAYGHGLKEVSGILKTTADWYGVDRLDEALELRKMGIKQPILVLGYVFPETLRQCVQQHISVVVYHEEILREARRWGGQRGTLKIHLKIETGTTRQGLQGEALIRLAKAAAAIPSINIEGAYTHFANIEDTSDPSYAMKQLMRFREELDTLARFGIRPNVLHTASSAASLLYPETCFDLVRPGIALYGHWPSRETQLVARKKKASVELK